MLALSIQTSTGEWQYLELPPDVKMTVVTVNPACDQSVVGRAFSYPFTLPQTQRNLAAMRHFSRLDSRYREDEFPARIYLGTDLYQVGVLTITEITDVIEATFSNQERRLIDYFSRIKLRDLVDMIEIPQDIEPIWVWELNTSGPITVFKIQINETTFSITTASADVAGAALVLQINDMYPGVASYNSGTNYLTIDPGWNYDPFVVRSCPAWGMEIHNFTNTALAREANFRAWVSNLRDSPAEWGCFPYVRWSQFYQLEGGGAGGINIAFVNAIFGSPPGMFAAPKNPVTDLPKRWNQVFVPFVRVKYVLDRIMETIESLTGWTGEIYAEDDTERCLIFSNYAMDQEQSDYWPNNDVDDLGPDQYLNRHQPQVPLKELVPNISALEFVEQYCGVRNLYITTNGTTSVEFRRRKDQVTDVPRDWRAYLQKPRTLYVVNRQGAGLKYVDEPLEMASVPDQLLPINADAGRQTEIAGTLYDVWAPVPCCYTVSPGRSAEWRSGDGEDATLRFLFERGVTDDYLGQAYLRSSHTDLDVDGVTQIGDYSLEIQGPSGLYERFHKGWLHLQDRPTADLYFVLPASEIKEMSKWKNARVKIYDPQGDVVVVVKSLEFEVSLTAIGVVKAEVVIQ